MYRKLSLALVAVATAFIVHSPAVAVQDTDARPKCNKCQAVEFELVGVDLPLSVSEKDEATCEESAAQKKMVAIQVECNGKVPFLSNLPLINHTFRLAPSKECEIIAVDAKSETCCDTEKDGCNCCKQCNCTCCSDQQAEVEVEVTRVEGVPFLSSVPYVNRLFKNVCITTQPGRIRVVGNCPASCVKTACSTNQCESSTCTTPACRTDTLVRLASHQSQSTEETEVTRAELMEALMEARVENARMEAKLDAMEHHIDLMEAMFELRAENESLKARLKMMEKSER